MFLQSSVCVCESLRFSYASGRHAVSQKNGDDGYTNCRKAHSHIHLTKLFGILIDKNSLS
jgi:hypothetical protein